MPPLKSRYYKTKLKNIETRINLKSKKIKMNAQRPKEFNPRGKKRSLILHHNKIKATLQVTFI